MDSHNPGQVYDLDSYRRRSAPRSRGGASDQREPETRQGRATMVDPFDLEWLFDAVLGTRPGAGGSESLR